MDSVARSGSDRMRGSAVSLRPHAQEMRKRNSKGRSKSFSWAFLSRSLRVRFYQNRATFFRGPCACGLCQNRATFLGFPFAGSAVWLRPHAQEVRKGIPRGDRRAFLGLFFRVPCACGLCQNRATFFRVPCACGLCQNRATFFRVPCACGLCQNRATFFSIPFAVARSGSDGRERDDNARCKKSRNVTLFSVYSVYSVVPYLPV